MSLAWTLSLTVQHSTVICSTALEVHDSTVTWSPVHSLLAGLLAVACRVEEVAMLESVVAQAASLQGLFKSHLQPVLSLPSGQRPLSCSRLSTILQVSRALGSQFFVVSDLDSVLASQ